MKYYKLKKHILRVHIGAKITVYRTDNENTEFEAVVIGKDKKTPWAKIEQSDEPLDTMDCDEITKSEYDRIYDDADFILNHSQKHL